MIIYFTQSVIFSKNYSYNEGTISIKAFFKIPKHDWNDMTFLQSKTQTDDQNLTCKECIRTRKQFQMQRAIFQGARL